MESFFFKAHGATKAQPSSDHTLPDTGCSLIPPLAAVPMARVHAWKQKMHNVAEYITWQACMPDKKF
jgi:hypothetical protein